MTKVIFSPEARLDLLQVGDHIGNDSPRRAVTFVKELRAKAKRIAFRPLAYPPRNDLRVGLRMAIHGQYLIFFEVAGTKRSRSARDPWGARPSLTV